MSIMRFLASGLKYLSHIKLAQQVANAAIYCLQHTLPPGLLHHLSTHQPSIKVEPGGVESSAQVRCHIVDHMEFQIFLPCINGGFLQLFGYFHKKLRHADDYCVLAVHTQAGQQSFPVYAGSNFANAVEVELVVLQLVGITHFYARE